MHEMHSCGHCYYILVLKTENNKAAGKLEHMICYFTKSGLLTIVILIVILFLFIYDFTIWPWAE